MSETSNDIESLRAELADLRSRLEALEPPRPKACAAGGRGTALEPAPADVDRRAILRRAGAVAVGAVAGGAVLAAGSAEPAAAANGGALIIGQANTGTVSTVLSGSDLYVSNGSDFVSVTGYHTALATTGVRGQATGAFSQGVWGSANANGSAGVFAQGSSAAVGLVVSSTGFAIPPASGNYSKGSFVVDGAGHLHYCYASGVGPASKWVRLSTSLVALASPVRVYDSRVGFNPPVAPKAKFADGEERVINTNYGGAVPIGATSAVVSIAATNTNPGGFFTIWKNGPAWPGTASLNWGSPGATVSNQVLVALDTLAQFRARMQGAGGADLVVDVVAYYT